MFENCYKIENVRLTGYVCKTNTPSNTAFRGFGAPQSMLVTETFMDEISGSLDHTPEQVKLFQKTAFGFSLQHNH